jgi:uncharacterized protein (UPF0264 family)
LSTILKISIKNLKSLFFLLFNLPLNFYLINPQKYFESNALMKILISPISVEEAVIAWKCGSSIIDIKNVKEGSLGASFPWIIAETIKNIPDKNVIFSATLGDLPFKPGTAALAALGAVTSGAQYVKAGLWGPKTVEEGIDLMKAVVRTCKDYNPNTIVVAAGYADYRRFNGLDPLALVNIANASGSDMVMLDTFYKDGPNLFDALTVDELAMFIVKAHQLNLKVALAGSIQKNHLPLLKKLNADVVGVRGAVCSASDRTTNIDPIMAKEFIHAANTLLSDMACEI